MSIIVNVLYSGKNGNAKKFAEEMIDSGIISRVRAEKGNLKYEYFLPMEDEESVLLVDEWESQAALDAHHASEVMQQIAALREKYDLHMSVKRLIEVSPNANDDKFIRK